MAKDPDIDVARRIFFGGLLALPWLWIVSLWYFRRRWADPAAPPELKAWLTRSAIGAAALTVVFLAWLVTFQLGWRGWGDWARNVLVWQPADGQWWLD